MVAIYARQSVERADSISTEQQVQFCRGAMTARELADCKSYVDKGYSGKNIDRPALQRLLSDVEAGAVHKLLVYRLDRISRSVHDFTGLCSRLSARRVHFQSVTEGITLDDTPAGTVMAQIMMVFAQFERETIQRRVTDNYFARAKAGMYLGGRPPFGFIKAETVLHGRRTACYAPDPARAPIAAGLFGAYLAEGASLGSLVRRLNAEGTRTARGGAWSTLTLGRLLRNPAFVRADAEVYRFLHARGAAMNDPVAAYDGAHGCYCYAPRQAAAGSKFIDLSHSSVTLAPHEGLVGAGPWLAVQHKLSAARGLGRSGSGTHSWLSGLMKCAKCGYAITVVNKPPGRRGHYINCGGRKLGPAVCPGRSSVVTLEEIEQTVQTHLLGLLRRCRTAQVQLPPPRTHEGDRLTRDIAARREEIGRLTDSLAHICEPDVIAIVSARIHEENRALQALLARQEAQRRIPAAPDLDRVFDAVPDEWHSYSIAEKKAVAAAVIARVEVSETQVDILFRLAPPQNEKEER